MIHIFFIQQTNNNMEKRRGGSSLFLAIFLTMGQVNGDSNIDSRFHQTAGRGEVTDGVNGKSLISDDSKLNSYKGLEFRGGYCLQQFTREASVVDFLPCSFSDGIYQYLVSFRPSISTSHPKKHDPHSRSTEGTHSWTFSVE